MTAIRYERHAQRGYTAAEFSASNEVLHDREIGVEVDTRRCKFGDGVTPWNDLDYAVSPLPEGVPVLLDRFTFTGAETSKTFNGPWPGYDRLTLRVRGRSQRAANTVSSLMLTLNGDGADANYGYQQVRVSDATTATAWIAARPELHIPAATAPAGFWAGFDLAIHGADDAQHKAIEWKLLRRNGTAAGDHFLYNSAGLWMGAAQLASIGIHDLNTAALVAGSTFSLFGQR